MFYNFVAVEDALFDVDTHYVGSGDDFNSLANMTFGFIGFSSSLACFTSSLILLED